MPASPSLRPPAAPKRRWLVGAIPALYAASLTGCGFADSAPSWEDQIAPGGPCYSFDLLDGIDTTSTAEEHAVFACLNRTGTIDAFRPVDAALDAPTRDDAVGLVLARWLATAGETAADLSLTGLVDAVVGLLDDRDAIEHTAHLAVELLYAHPWVDLPTDTGLAAPELLGGGVVLPLLDVAGAEATALLDDDLDALPALADALRSDRTRQLVWTLAGVAEGSSGLLQTLAADWPEDVADALVRTSDATNDRTPSPTGNSGRDTLAALLAGDTLDALAVPLAELLGDAVLEAGVRVALTDAVTRGGTAVVPGDVLHLASIDADGGTLDATEDSALHALLRLLARANRPADCSIDLDFTSIDFSLGNLAVALLQAFADLDPDAAVDSLGLLGDLLGAGLTESVLQAIADTGVCPALDDQLVADLPAIDRLNDTPELLRLLIGVLGAAADHVPAVADAVTVAYDAGLVPPAEELVRDLADGPLVTDAVAFLPAVLEPGVYYDVDELPADVDPLAFEDAWRLAADLLQDDARATLRTLAGPLVETDGAWTALAHLAALLEDDEAETRGLLDDVAAYAHGDPDLDAAHAAADVVGDPAFVRPLLVVVEADGARAALAATEADDEGPLPFVARLALGGTLDVLLDTLALFRSLLPEDPPDA